MSAMPSKRIRSAATSSNASTRITRTRAREAKAKSEPLETQTPSSNANPRDQGSSSTEFAKSKAASKPTKSQDKKPSTKRNASETEEIGAPSAKRRRASNPVDDSKSQAKLIKTQDQASASYWLMKAEPDSRIEKGKDVKFSIDDLRSVTEPEPWSGVRSHQAKKLMMAMKKGDLAFFYHSNCKVPGIVGIMEIIEEATVDTSAFDAADPYFDPKSHIETPKWFCVKVGFREKFKDPSSCTLAALRKHSGSGEALTNMQLFTQSRLSVSKVSPSEWGYILGLAGESET